MGTIDNIVLNLYKQDEERVTTVGMDLESIQKVLILIKDRTVMKPIRSSEISSYLFCPVCWWIGITEGVKITSAMVEGEKHHKHVAENTTKAGALYACIIVITFILIAVSLCGVLL